MSVWNLVKNSSFVGVGYIPREQRVFQFHTRDTLRLTLLSWVLPLLCRGEAYALAVMDRELQDCQLDVK